MTTAIQTNIKRQLIEKNMTAAELERRTGIPHAVINILHGRSKNPSIRTAQAIAKELGCSVEELFSEPKEKTFCNNKTNTSWNAELYHLAFTAVCEHIKNQDVAPTPNLVSECITEVYMYTLDSPQKTVDQRFVQWLIQKTFKHPDNNSLD